MRNQDDLEAFGGLQAVIVSIIANAAVLFGLKALKNWRDTGIAIVAALMFGFAINPMVAILTARCLGASA